MGKAKRLRKARKSSVVEEVKHIRAKLVLDQTVPLFGRMRASEILRHHLERAGLEEEQFAWALDLFADEGWSERERAESALGVARAVVMFLGTVEDWMEMNPGENPNDYFWEIVALLDEDDGYAGTLAWRAIEDNLPDWAADAYLMLSGLQDQEGNVPTAAELRAAGRWH